MKAIPKFKYVPTDEKELKVYTFVKSNISVEKIAEHLKISRQGVYNIMQRFKPTKNPCRTVSRIQLIDALNNNDNMNDAANQLGVEPKMMADLIRYHQVQFINQ